MPLWTLLGLLARQSRQRRGRSPKGPTVRQGLLGMPRYQPEFCSDGCKACADICPTKAITMRAGTDSGKLDVDYGRCVVCQLCTEACPTGAMSPSSDWAFGVRSRDDLVWAEKPAIAPIAGTQDAVRRVPAQPAYPPRRCRLLQWLRIRTAGVEQSVLQSASARHFLHGVAAFRRSAAGHRAGHQCHARTAARHL